MIGMDFCEPYAGNNIVSFSHGKDLSCFQLYHCIPPFAGGGGGDAE